MSVNLKGSSFLDGHGVDKRVSEELVLNLSSDGEEVEGKESSRVSAI